VVASDLSWTGTGAIQPRRSKLETGFACGKQIVRNEKRCRIVQCPTSSSAPGRRSETITGHLSPLSKTGRSNASWDAASSPLCRGRPEKGGCRLSITRTHTAARSHGLSPSSGKGVDTHNGNRRPARKDCSIFPSFQARSTSASLSTKNARLAEDVFADIAWRYMTSSR